jgi:pseudouridine-5'-monophosphatase
MNKPTIEESRKAIEQSVRLTRLTLLATLFIPLSFTSSLLAMNIDFLGQNVVEYWWYFHLCVSITLVACGFYLWVFKFLKRCYVSYWQGCRSFT